MFICMHLVKLSSGLVDSINWCNYQKASECVNLLNQLNVIYELGKQAC